MDDATRLRRKDTTKGPPLRILCLDGGGVRGYSMLIILQELMHRTFVEIEGRAPKRHEIPKPADHFDLIAGTGTGGLIAIMLGRLRLDIDTCKDVYVRMTRRVFETDKTFHGIPYKSTLFKASKLEEAIRECVREHTVFEDEGNDVLANAVPMSDLAISSPASIRSDMQRSSSTSSRYSQVGMSPVAPPRSFGPMRWGNPNALLYDTRDNRTKTAVTAMFANKRNTPTTSVLLRSYDSRKEPAPDTNCTIWQAGRATSATGLAFKPIQIGQSIYHDEGSGTFNPSPQILDEAVQNEYPGRDVGVFISIGTGRRPSGTASQQHEWWESFMSGSSVGDFADARRRLIAKIEGCEDTHRAMLREHLAARHVPVDNYYRLNVEVGVGEFGMNEWHRLSDISTNTRMYLGKQDVQAQNLAAAAKMARIHFAKQRHERTERSRGHGAQQSWETPISTPAPIPNPTPNPWGPTSAPTAIELPGSEPLPQPPPSRASLSQSRAFSPRASLADAKYSLVSDPPPQNSDTPAPLHPRHSHSHSRTHHSPPCSPRPSTDWHPPSPPPLPPKTPLPYPSESDGGMGMGSPRTFVNMGSLERNHNLPYPETEGPPPVVNMGSKPSVTR